MGDARAMEVLDDSGSANSTSYVKDRLNRDGCSAQTEGVTCRPAATQVSAVIRPGPRRGFSDAFSAYASAQANPERNALYSIDSANEESVVASDPILSRATAVDHSVEQPCVHAIVCSANTAEQGSGTKRYVEDRVWQDQLGVCTAHSSNEGPATTSNIDEVAATAASFDTGLSVSAASVEKFVSNTGIARPSDNLHNLAGAATSDSCVLEGAPQIVDPPMAEEEESSALCQFQFPDSMEGRRLSRSMQGELLAQPAIKHFSGNAPRTVSSVPDSLPPAAEMHHAAAISENPSRGEVNRMEDWMARIIAKGETNLQNLGSESIATPGKRTPMPAAANQQHQQRGTLFGQDHAVSNSVSNASPESSSVLVGTGKALGLAHDFKPGDEVHIWSNSKSAWMPDGVIDEVLSAPAISDGLSVTAGTTLPAGAVKVTSSAGTKWVMPSLVASQIRKACRHSYTVGTKVHVWSNSKGMWVEDGQVCEISQGPVRPGVNAPPLGAVRVVSSVGEKWVMPDQLDVQLRKAIAAEDRVCTKTVARVRPACKSPPVLLSNLAPQSLEPNAPSGKLPVSSQGIAAHVSRLGNPSSPHSCEDHAEQQERSGVSPTLALQKSQRLVQANQLQQRLLGGRPPNGCSDSSTATLGVGSPPHLAKGVCDQPLSCSDTASGWLPPPRGAPAMQRMMHAWQQDRNPAIVDLF